MLPNKLKGTKLGSCPFKSHLPFVSQFQPVGRILGEERQGVVQAEVLAVHQRLQALQQRPRLCHLQDRIPLSLVGSPAVLVVQS